MVELRSRITGAETSNGRHRKMRDTVVRDKAASAGPRSLKRMLGIFDAIAHSPDGLSLAELSSRLGSPKSSLLTLLRPMVADNFLTHTNSRYTLGNESFALATSILSTRKFQTVVRGLMVELQQQCPETIILAVVDRAAQTVVYTDVLESPQLIRYSVPSGSARPLYTSAAAQVLLAHQDEKWREQYLKRTKLKPLTAHTITDVVQLRKKLERWRERASQSASPRRSRARAASPHRYSAPMAACSQHCSSQAPLPATIAMGRTGASSRRNSHRAPPGPSVTQVPANWMMINNSFDFITAGNSHVCEIEPPSLCSRAISRFSAKHRAMKSSDRCSGKRSNHAWRS